MLPLVGGSLRRLQPCVGTTQGYESFQDLGRGCGKGHRVEFGTPWGILSRHRVGTLAFAIESENWKKAMVALSSYYWLPSVSF